MITDEIFRENSKRLKKFFSHYHPLYGDQEDTDRFLFDIKGIKKAYIPISMKSLPLIQKLIASRSLSKFKRSDFFKKNFNSISHLLSSLHQYRLKYDFPYWISKNFPNMVNLKEFRSLLSFLNSCRWDSNPPRVIIRNNFEQDPYMVILLFILWFKSYTLTNTNVMVISRASLIHHNNCHREDR